MAKDPNNLASNFETENTGGVLSGFLAEEDDFDRRTLWRLGSWAVASVGAVIVAVLANQSSIGMRREQVASADLAQQSQQIQSVAKQSQSEARRLASAIETLNGDRDRLYTRVTVLEQGLDSVTGSIAKQSSKAESSKVEISRPESAKADKSDNARPDNAKPASPQAAIPAASTTAELPAVPQNAPVVAPVTTTVAATVEKPPAPARTVTAVTDPAPAAVASISQGGSTAPAVIAAAPPPPAAASPASPSLAPSNPASTMEWKSLTAPPGPAAAKLVEANTLPNTPPKTVMSAPIPQIVAAVPPAAEAEADETPAKPADVAVQRTEFGVDVGGANSVGGLRALWRGLLKSRSNAALTVLRPIIVVKENNSGPGMQLRLVAGPLADAAAAAKICATMGANQRSCETTVFDGQRLAMNASDEPAAPAKPASVRRRSASKRVAVDEPKKPEPSKLERFFSRQ